jgi:hypothetical protein
MVNNRMNNKNAASWSAIMVWTMRYTAQQPTVCYFYIYTVIGCQNNNKTLKKHWLVQYLSITLIVSRTFRAWLYALTVTAMFPRYNSQCGRSPDKDDRLQLTAQRVYSPKSLNTNCTTRCANVYFANRTSFSWLYSLKTLSFNCR